MAKVTRYDPLSADLDDFFQGLFIRPMLFDLDTMPRPKIKLDVKASIDAYTIKAALPGAKKQDIHVDVDAKRLMISAEVEKSSEENEDEELLRSERYYGKLERRLTLDSDVDETKAHAMHSDGVLRLVLPRRLRVSSKQLMES